MTVPPPQTPEQATSDGRPAPPVHEAPPFTPGAPAGASHQRPGTVTGAVVLLGVYALLSLCLVGYRGVTSFLRDPSNEWLLGMTIKDAGMLVVLLLVVVIAAVLTAQGSDAGRALALAVSGYAGLGAISGVSNTVIFGLFGHWDIGSILTGLVMIVEFGLAAMVFVLLVTRSAADWFHEQRTAAP